LTAESPGNILQRSSPGGYDGNEGVKGREEKERERRQALKDRGVPESAFYVGPRGPYLRNVIHPCDPQFN